MSGPRRALFAGILLGRLIAGAETPELPELSGGALPLRIPGIHSAWERVSKNPLDPEANGALGMLLHSHEQLETAETCYQRAHILQPRDKR